MTNTTHAALSVREMQQLAVCALDELLSHDLPELSWNLSKNISRPELSGLVNTELSDDEQREAVHAWAKVLKNAELIERRARTGGYTLIRVVGEYEHVTVSVWCHVDYEDEVEW